MAVRTKSNPKPAAKTAIDAAKKEVAIKTASNLNLDGVTKQLAATQVSIQKTLAEVGTALSAELSTLQALELAIAAKREELARFHAIEVEVTQIEEVRAQLEALQGEYKELATQLQKDREREEREYVYKRDIARRQEEDNYAQSRANLDRERIERERQANEALTKRQELINAAENELTQLRNEVKAYPDKLAKEVNAAVTKALVDANKEFGHKLKVTQVEAEAALAATKKDYEAAKAMTVYQQQEIEKLKQENASIRADLTRVSQQAIESASGRRELELLQSNFKSVIESGSSSLGQGVEGSKRR